MRELALCAGAGGSLLASRILGWRTVCAVEFEPYRRDVVIARQRDGWLDPFPVWDDLRTFDGKPWCGRVDVVSGGFPCQPFSVAGKQCAGDDSRNLWPDVARVLREIRPRYAFLENVPGLLALGRIGGAGREGTTEPRDDGASRHLADADEERRQRRTDDEEAAGATGCVSVEGDHARDVESGLGRGAHGLADWVDRHDAWPEDWEAGLSRIARGVDRRRERLEAIGDGQVPQCAAEAFRRPWRRMMEPPR